jgi:predicted transcriptional regulator
VLQGEPVRRFMMANPVTVPASASLEELVDEYIYRYHYKMFPVLEASGKLIGCIRTKQVKVFPRSEWSRKTVAEVADNCSMENTVKPQDDAMKTLLAMTRTGVSRLLVTEGSRLVGIITLKDMLKFFSLKMELVDEQ